MPRICWQPAELKHALARLQEQFSFRFAQHDLDSRRQVQGNLDTRRGAAFELIQYFERMRVFLKHNGSHRNYRRAKPAVARMSAAEDVAVRPGLPATQIGLRVIAKVPEMIGRNHAVDFLAINHRGIVTDGRTEAIALPVISGIDIGAAVGNQVDSIQYRLK